MNFQDNFSETLLMSESDVIFYYEDMYLIKNVCFNMHLLKIKDSLNNPYIQFALSFFNLSSNDLKTKFGDPHIHNLWSLLNLLGLDNNSFTHRCVRYYMEFVFENQFTQKNKKWFINDIEIDERLFNRIQDISLVICGTKKFHEQNSINGEDERPQWLIDAEEQIKKIKQQSKPNQNYFEDLMKMFLPLNYELGYSLEELFNMNYFHVWYLHKYIPKIVNYDIGKRQFMSKKKLQYITD